MHGFNPKDQILCPRNDLHNEGPEVMNSSEESSCLSRITSKIVVAL